MKERSPRFAGKLTDKTERGVVTEIGLWAPWPTFHSSAPWGGRDRSNAQVYKSALSDLSPLNGLPLKALTCDFKADRDAVILRGSTTLRTINGKPAADYWKEADARPVHQR